ncbi:MAG TPA: universal stress protein [Coleofasciculaceae cyanobacterium]|jgi:nucleotide-binding universal stress UspA family protein
MKILISVDGSENSNYMVEWACQVFHKENNEFYLFTVISEPMLTEYKLEDAVAILAKAKDKLESCGFQVKKAEYMTGDPAQRICQYADDEAVDQVLMGSHGRSGLAKVLLGSVSEAVLEHCNQSVFIYRHYLNVLANSKP